MPTPDFHRAPPSPLCTLDALLCTFSALSSKTATSSLRASTDGLVSSPAAAPLPETARPYLLTLHVLFPHCLLDALDLLDRGCVTRVVLADEEYCDERNIRGEGQGEGDAGMRDERDEAVDPTGDADDSVDVTKGHSADENNETTRSRPASKAQAQAQAQGSTPPPTPTTRIVGYNVASIPTSTAASASTSTTSGAAAPASSTTDTPHPPWGRDKDADLDRPTRHHAVHLRSWTCTCPAFAFAAYARPADLSAPNLESRGAAPMRRGRAHETRGVAGTRLGGYLTFGGLCAGGAGAASGEETSGVGEGEGLGGSVGGKRERLPPVCKHLLACVLGELCPGFFGRGYGHADGDYGARQEVAITRGVRERNMSVEEAAGWVGGGIL